MPELDVQVAWRSGAPAEPLVRRRLQAELRAAAWTLSQLQLLAHDAGRLTGAQHAYLLPRLEVRLPLYDIGRRFRMVLTHLDDPRVALIDEDGRCIADVWIP